jgi:hypothetical protein
MEKKIWVTNLMYPAVYTDDSKTIIDFSKNKSNVIVDSYNEVFTNQNKMQAYIASHKNTAGILTVSEKIIKVGDEDLNTVDEKDEKLNTISRDLLSLFSRTPPVTSVEDVFNSNTIWVVVATEFTRKNKDMKFEFSHNNIFGLYKNPDDARHVADTVYDEIKERAWGFKEGLRDIEVNTIPVVMPTSVEQKDNETNSNTNNSRLIPQYKDHLFAVIELSEYKEQTNGSVTAIFVSEENAKKYADELLEHLNAEKHRTIVKSYRVLVQPIPKEDIEKPGVNTPVTDGWYLPPKK